MTSGAACRVLPMRRASRAAAAIKMPADEQGPVVAGICGHDGRGLSRDQVVGAGDRHGGQDGQAERAADLLGRVQQPRRQARLVGGTPALAAAVTETNTDPAPSDITRNPGSRSLTYEPCRGTLDT